jgi:hypothetical protein
MRRAFGIDQGEHLDFVLAGNRHSIRSCCEPVPGKAVSGWDAACSVAQLSKAFGPIEG